MASPGSRESDDRRGGSYNNREREPRRDFNRDSRGGGGRDYNSSRGGRRDDHRGDRPDRPSERSHARSRSPARNDRRHNDRPRSPRPNNPRDQDRPRRGSDDRRPTAPRAGGASGGGASVPSSRAPQAIRGREIKTEMDVDAEDGEDIDEETVMKKVMGFGGFRSTKNTKVPGNDRLYGVRKDKQTQYRQYMNRVGGFNRPLSPSRM